MNLSLDQIVFAAIIPANIYIGRAMAVREAPRGVAERASTIGVTLAGLVMGGGFAFFAWRRSDPAHALTFQKAAILAGCTICTYVFYRSLTHRAVSLTDRFNPRLRAFVSIAKRHGWDLTSSNAIDRVPSSQLRFDGADYDAIMQLKTDGEMEIRRQTCQSAPSLWPEPRSDADYHDACVRELLAMVHILDGSDGIDGLVHLPGPERELDDFDWAAFEQVKRLASAAQKLRDASRSSSRSR